MISFTCWPTAEASDVTGAWPPIGPKPASPGWTPGGPAWKTGGCPPPNPTSPAWSIGGPPLLQGGFFWPPKPDMICNGTAAPSGNRLSKVFIERQKSFKQLFYNVLSLILMYNKKIINWSVSQIADRFSISSNSFLFFTIQKRIEIGNKHLDVFSGLKNVSIF